ncbi:MAG: prepilin peptidase [Candidatus Dadabacteria bacterium]|nr:prepilin peptidase [Candidatus Dadabacteria bacterium]NIQ16466.1 prepilin peptidase [Candidatus Dadabacteria bacterium]
MAIELIAFLFGTVIGSFLNVCIHRIPEGESIVFPPSHCPNCKNKIKPQHNIPILSYLFLKGKCFFCGNKISVIYPLTELIAGIFTFLLFIKFGFSVEFIFYLILFSSLIVITFIDLKHMIIPNVISLPGILVGLLFNVIRTDWSGFLNLLSDINSYNMFKIISQTPVLNSITGIIVGGGIFLLIFLLISFVYKLIRKVEGLGMGDVKLLAMLGAFLGPSGVFYIIFISSFVGTIVGLSYIVYKKGDMKYAMPYGPFLSAAGMLYVFTGGLSFIFSFINTNNF